MSIIRNILARVLALWAILWFIITMLIVLIPILSIVLLKEPTRMKILRNIFYVWMSFFFFAIGLRLRVKGKGNFKKGNSYIVVCNHNSLMDIPICTPFIPGANKTIAKIEMSRVPLFGLIYKLGSVLVDRRSEESRKASYGKMKEVLDMGMHMCIYPEGTRNKSNNPLQPFHDGAFRLAVDTGHSVLPAVLFNTAKALPNNKTFFYWPTKVEIHFLDPIAVDSQTKEQLKARVFNRMRDYYLQHRD
jgi:1-acyl-sn-glycerol-3-phosphate acyltransferase